MVLKELYTILLIQYSSHYEKWIHKLQYIRQQFLHSYNTIIIVASNMEPCAGIDKGRVPTL